MLTNPWRLVVAGVGGQGVLATAGFVAEAIHRRGLPVLAGQLHGMAQRGGAVTATVVAGGHTSQIADGAADTLLATEPLEALRVLSTLRPGGLAIVNTHAVPLPAPPGGGTPAPAIDLNAVLDAIRRRARLLVALDATALAQAAGSPRALNVVMLGLLAVADKEACPAPAQALIEAIATHVAKGAIPLNRRAFDSGMNAARLHGPQPP